MAAMKSASPPKIPRRMAWKRQSIMDADTTSTIGMGSMSAISGSRDCSAARASETDIEGSEVICTDGAIICIAVVLLPGHAIFDTEKNIGATLKGQRVDHGNAFHSGKG